MKKNFIHITLIFVALLAFTACNDFLDIQPVGKVIPQTGEEYRALLTEAYCRVPSDRGKTVFRSDEVILDKASTSTEGLNLYLDVWRWQDTNPDENTSSFDWLNFYYVNYIANSVLETWQAMTDVTAAERNQMAGEAYMLRAYMHYVLVNLYAEPYTHCDPARTKGIPLALNSDVNAVLSRNTIAEVYASILSDINEAEKLLNVETWGEGETYRFNTLSVEAFRARIYLYMGNWEKAYEAATQVVERHGQLEDMTVSSKLPNHYTSVEAILSLEEIYPSGYQTEGRVSDALFGLYRSGDMRKSKFYRQITASTVNVLKGGSDEYRCTFRSAEFYLIAAEAALELGDETNALYYLTELMKKRYAAAKYPEYEALVTAMTPDELRQEIQDERFRELAFEGHRWFDLRRTTRPELTKTYLEETYTLEKDDPRYTLRIPSVAVEANPNLAE